MSYGFGSLVGFAVAFIGMLWLLVTAFKTSLWWGLASLLLPPVLIIFALVYLKVTWQALLLWIAGLVVLFAAAS